MLTKKANDTFWGWMFVAPGLVFFVALVAYPTIRTAVLSFTDLRFGADEFDFIGFQNFHRMLTDEVFWISLRNNGYYIVYSIAFQIGFGLILAAILTRGIRKGQIIYRVLFFAPMVISQVAVGLVWRLVYDPNVGQLASLLKLIGLQPPPAGILGNVRSSIFGVITVNNWQYTGYVMVILIAAMVGVAEEQYEAASIEGANGFTKFFRITIPNIRNALFLCLLFEFVGSMKTYTNVAVLTSGGPNNSSQVLGTYVVFRAFLTGEMGYASAISIVLLIFGVFLGVIQSRSQRRMV